MALFGRKKDESPATDRRAQVIKALAGVRDPVSGKSVVETDSIKNLTFSDDEVAFTVESTSPVPALKSQAENAVKALPWVHNVHVQLERVAAAPGEDTIRDIIAVASGKGGVGKSTVATNLAFALKRDGARVGLLDCDIYGPSVPHMLGLKGAKPEIETVNGRQRIMPIEHEGILTMSMGYMVETEKPVIWRGPMVHQAIKQFFTEVAWGGLDYLVVDLPPGTGDAQLTMVQQVPVTGAVVVTTPQDVAMIDARKAFNMFRDTNVTVLGIVENMSTFICPHCSKHSDIFGKDGARDWAKEAGVRFLGAIPLHMRIRVQGDSGTPAVAAADSEAEVVEAFTQLGKNVADQLRKNATARPAKKALSLDNTTPGKFEV